MKYLNDVTNDCAGKVFKSKLSGDFKILKYSDSRNVVIQFLKTGFETVTRLDCVRNGNIKDPYLPSVCGVGIIGTKYPSKINGVHTKEYTLWRNMLKRCYSTTLKKKYPTYKDCEASDNFLYYEYFYEWCNSQIGFGNQDWQLDKDLLFKGNKVYSEDSCVFIPKEINSLLTKSDKVRGKHLIGVHWCNASKAFVAMVSKNKGGQKHLGYFNTELEAFNTYKTAKEAFIKEQAEKWKSQIDERAYNTLMNYQVEMDD